MLALLKNFTQIIQNKSVVIGIILFLSISLHFVFADTITADTSTTDTTAAKEKNQPTIVVIPISGTVDPGMAAYIARSLRDSEEYGDRLIILEMDTFGGRVDAAFQIVDTILSITDPKTIAYVKTKAISAGALIALAADELVMKHNTTIGDVAPLTMGEDGPKMLGEKFQSPLRAKFRTLAKRNGYSEVLTESMVTADIIVYEIQFPDTTVFLDSTEYAELSSSRKNRIISKKTVVQRGELLTMEDQEAERLGFSEMSVGSLEEMLTELGYENPEIVRMEESWSEQMVRFIGTIAPILMMIGFAALYIELRTPGFGVPGIIGVVCLSAVFFGQYAVGLADYTELLLILIGLALLAIEVFVLPGFGIAGIGGIAFIIAGMVLSFQYFVIPKPEFPWQAEMLISNLVRVFGSILGSMILIVLFFRYIFPRIGLVIKGPYLNASLQGVRIDSPPDLDTTVTSTVPTIKVGDKGEVITALRPSGKVSINGEYFDVVTEGEFMEKGTPIMVTQASGNRIVVTREPTS